MILTLPDRAERRRIIKKMHKTKDKDHYRHLNAILLLADGQTVTKVSLLLAAARSSVNRWIHWYTEYGLKGLESLSRGRTSVLPFVQIAAILKTLIEINPQHLGYQRSRWSTELMAMEVNRIFDLKVHASTIRRWLPKLGIVWRRAVPTLHIKDPEKEAKLARIKQALEQCDIDHPVFYEDEVDIHLNPKIGADWMHQGKGQQKKVVTPGQNAKHYLAGALHATTGKVTYVASASKSSELFIAMLECLKRQYRRAKTITLIVDNYIIHKSKKIQSWLKKNPKFILLFQPVYSPWVNKIEKLWHALHETVTRNHQCKTMWQLLQRVRYFLDNVSPFPGGGHGSMKVERN
ncbi:Integrase core domain protein [Vibrio aerogenes CECT 7868]|uniref:Integrase core domain protein n=1 Tax=Vibrio aerogenes CECT 7868 TaxID=1216006 RepID=A0A1M5ZEL0_9VIBR|nr:IS630 family transposase [Vibrio aerogenes]SHI22695.1 Integrase core domain protein [Vibrio aerogenes CECT 7868]